MKKLAISIIILIALASTSMAWLNFSKTGKKFKAIHLPKTTSKENISHSNPEHQLLVKLRSRAASIRPYVKNKGFNNDFCFLIDMSMPSGKNRFLVYDLRKDSLLHSGLVTHGRCNEDWLEGRRYSNKIGSGCTSLGKYKVGASYQGRFGLAFKLHGLDKTNNNAYKRYVVLHAHECVPETAVEEEICQSDGCPTVSTGYLQYLDNLIQKSKKPVLLWIFE